MPRRKSNSVENLENVNPSLPEENPSTPENEEQSPPPPPEQNENVNPETPDDDEWAFNGVKTLAANDPENPDRAVRYGGWKPAPPGILYHNVEFFHSLESEFSDQSPRYAGPEVFLWESLWYIFDGKYPSWRWQNTGSCVESGYNNAVKVLMAQEVISQKLPKAYVQPFTFHVYGMSRYIGLGDDGMGEGSFGSSMAEAGKQYGILPIDFPDVDKPVVCGRADAYGAEVELKWSSIRRHPESIRNKKFPYTIKFVRCRNLRDAEIMLRFGYPLTWAGDWGGRSRGKVRGSKYPILMMDRWETWHHQQSCLGLWQHPELGRVWYIQNNWWGPGGTKFEVRNGYVWRITSPGDATPMHGEHPEIKVSGWNHPPFPAGGYWIADNDMEYQIRRGEVFALVLFDGFTGRRIQFGNI